MGLTIPDRDSSGSAGDEMLKLHPAPLRFLALISSSVIRCRLPHPRGHGSITVRSRNKK